MRRALKNIFDILSNAVDQDDQMDVEAAIEELEGIYNKTSKNILEFKINR
jgi:hypothetical protein